MLAVSAGRRLALLDPQTLRSTSAPPSPSKQTALDVEFTALAWANPTVANSRLYVATRSAIRQYDSTGHFEKAILNDSTISKDDPVSAIVMKNADELFLARRSKVCKLECNTGNVEDVFNVGEAMVSGITLSSDATRLAVSSSDQCIVLNISGPGPNCTTLAGISGCSAVSFHSHSSRLLLASGRYLIVYDVSETAESLEPRQKYTLGPSTSAKEAVGIACSPFSASLVVVAFKAGTVCMVDLDREKGLFKTLDMKMSLTSIAFSADGTNLLLGTENGQLLVLDLRGLDRPPKKITITSDGKRVVGIAVQKRFKTAITESPGSPPMATAKSAKQTSPKSVKPLASHDLNVKKPSLPHRPASAVYDNAKSSNPLASPPATRASRASSTRNPSDTPAKMRKASAAASKPTPGRKASSSATPGKPAGGSLRGRENAHLGVARTLSADTSQEKMESLSTLLSRRKLDGSSTVTNSTKPTGATAASPMLSRLRKTSLAGKSTSSSSRGSSVVTSRALKTTLTVDVRSRTGSSASASVASTISARKIFPRKEDYGEGAASSAGTRTRSPSPNFDVELPSPTTTLPALPRQRAAMDEVTSGVTIRSKSKGRKNLEDGLDVDGVRTDHFSASSTEAVFRREESTIKDTDVDIASAQDFDEEIDTERSFHADLASASANSSAVQLSPLRGAGLHQTPPRPDLFNFSMDPSNRVEDFLKNVFKDAIYDFQQETRSELLGLHLDVLKSGQGWKREMRDVMEEYMDDDEGSGIAELRRLREENRRLREEVARLKACV